jgi:hypothetical protein
VLRQFDKYCSFLDGCIFATESQSIGSISSGKIGFISGLWELAYSHHTKKYSLKETAIFFAGATTRHYAGT